MGRTIAEKIAAAHLTSGPAGREVRAGDFVTVRPKHVMTHDNTAAVLKKFRGLGVPRVHDPRQPVFALDHDIQNVSAKNLAKYAMIERFAREQGIDFWPAGTGIGHQVMLEQGYVTPGALVVASDSHSNMYGAVGALGTPVVRTDAAAIWASGETWWQVPPTVQVVLEGRLREGVTGKDVILALCRLYSAGEVLNAAVEFTGPGVAELSIDARMTIANMTTEWGALTGWFPVDDPTIAWFRERLSVLERTGRRPFTAADINRWAQDPPAPDADARYAARIVLDLGEVVPHVAGPDTVQAGAPLPRVAREEIPVDRAYILSCVNSRLEDLEAAARVVAGKKVRARLYVAAASREIQAEAERRGTWRTLKEAGAVMLPPACGPCIGLGTGLLEPGEVGISATNRNFRGRMGSRDARCYLASPAVVAASALAGKITGPAEWDMREPTRRIEVFAREAPAPERVEILPGFPERVRGRLVFLPHDNLNTDGIYGKDYTYREDVTREEMARVVMENYDPDFAGRVREGDILVGGFNFGTGSSREQAVTALQAAGIGLIIAAGFSQTYLRNAFNNGLPCIVQPDLVAALRERFPDEVAAGQRTIIPGEELEVDFAAGVVRWDGKEWPFPALSGVPQALVVAGGVENLVRQKLAAGGNEEG